MKFNINKILLIVILILCSLQNFQALESKIELQKASDLEPLIKRMKAKQFFDQHLNHHPDLFHFLV